MSIVGHIGSFLRSKAKECPKPVRVRFRLIILQNLLFSAHPHHLSLQPLLGQFIKHLVCILSSGSYGSLESGFDQAEDLLVLDDLLQASNDDIGAEIITDVTEVGLEEPEIASKVGADSAEESVSIAAGAESVGLGRELGLKEGFQEEKEKLLNDAVLEGRRGGGEEGVELTAGQRASGGGIGGRS